VNWRPYSPAVSAPNRPAGHPDGGHEWSTPSGEDALIDPGGR
jgi:hypothetical protein